MNYIQLAGTFRFIFLIAGVATIVSLIMLLIAFSKKKPKKRIGTLLLISWIIMAFSNWYSEHLLRGVVQSGFAFPKSEVVKSGNELIDFANSIDGNNLEQVGHDRLAVFVSAILKEWEKQNIVVNGLPKDHESAVSKFIIALDMFYSEPSNRNINLNEAMMKIREIVSAQPQQNNLLASPQGNKTSSVGQSQKASTDKALVSQLVHSSESGNIREVNRLLEMGVDPNANYEGTLALERAALFGHKEIVRALLKRGADPNLRDVEGGTILESAVYNYDIPNKTPDVIREIVNLLLSAGANPNTISEFNAEGTTSTVLIKATSNDLPAVVNDLLKAGADPNLADNFNNTPLSIAINAGYTEIAKMLLNQGANPNIKDSNGKTALMYAQEQGNSEIVNLIYTKVGQHNKNPQSKQQKELIHKKLYEAVSRNNIQEVQQLIASGGDPNKSTALLTAVSHQNIDMVKLLLKSGADPNPELFHGATPLSTAVWNNNIEIATILLEAGAKPDMTATSELWKAVENVNTEMVRKLLSYGADPNSIMVYEGDKTILQIAKEKGLREISELLIQAGAK